MSEFEFHAEFKAAVADQFRAYGSASPITAIAPDTGKEYVIWDDRLIPIEVAGALILDALDEAVK